MYERRRKDGICVTQECTEYRKEEMHMLKSTVFPKFGCSILKTLAYRIFLKPEELCEWNKVMSDILAKLSFLLIWKI